MGRYVVETRLGAGGMAEVFVARQLGAEGFERRVAIKRMGAGLSQDPQFARRFIAEARIAATLTHPNIVSIIDFDRDDDGALFLAMELVDGADLRRILQNVRPGGFEPELAAHIVAEVLKGLSYAHGRDDADGTGPIVHRDVSPHNVLVSRSGAVKLADFGIAKATALSSVSRSGTISGKLGYMAPEQASGEAVDPRTDLFATGVLFYELVCGERPFDGATEAEILGRLLRGRYEPLSSRKPDIPLVVAQVVERLLAPRPDDRYPSADAALADLHAWEDFPKDGASRLAKLVADLPRTEREPVFAQGSPVPDSVADPSSVVEAAKPRRGWLVALGLGATLSVAAALWVWLGPLGPKDPAPAVRPAAAEPAAPAETTTSEPLPSPPAAEPAPPGSSASTAGPAAAASPDAAPQTREPLPSMTSAPTAEPATHDRKKKNRRPKTNKPPWALDVGDRPPSEIPVSE